MFINYNSFLSLILLLFLSTHACTGRRLQLEEKVSNNLLSEKDIAEANTDETRTRTVDKLMNNVNDQEKGRQETAASKERKMMDESSGGIQGGRTMQKPKNRKIADDSDDDLLVNHVQESHKKKISGSGKISGSLGVSAKNIEVMERPSRSQSMQGFGSHVTNQKRESNVIGKGENPVVVMSDYAEAHRRPPIHNLSP
ncbi:hypothetical protein C5167_032303 [Papaver somniferum]|uniref:Uncharacterized protein n=1 Tax=Papaver somniferum TaxID=3469 RepID=A0A4Y7K8T0_PAPSO|nr:uncharacterized protein LOC113292647 [Papaver somniferum]RZC69216.1 hypothetical protein C5167_032303 [Papaver somniferum]